MFLGNSPFPFFRSENEMINQLAMAHSSLSVNDYTCVLSELRIVNPNYRNRHIANILIIYRLKGEMPRNMPMRTPLRHSVVHHSGCSNPGSQSFAPPPGVNLAAPLRGAQMR